MRWVLPLLLICAAACTRSSGAPAPVESAPPTPPGASGPSLAGDAASDSTVGSTDGAATAPPDDAATGLRVLLFTKTGLTDGTVWDHTQSMGCTNPLEGDPVDTQGAAVAALQALAAERAWVVTVSDDESLFDDGALAAFDVVVFTMTSGGIFDAGEETALQDFIHAGKGFVALHTSSTEWDWQWYQELCGGTFITHPLEPRLRTVELVPLDGDVTVASIQADWTHADELYAFWVDASQPNAPTGNATAIGPDPATNPNLTISLNLVESTVDASTNLPSGWSMGPVHPMSWHQEFEGGRSYYIALGHCPAAYADPAFLTHVAQAIDWAGRRL